MYLQEYRHQKNKERIIDYINSHERVTKQDIIDYMKSGVPKDRTSRVTTLNLIKELEAAGRIKVLNKDDWRQGQSQYLVINDKNQFDWITEQIENIETMFTKDHPEEYRKGLDYLLHNLSRVHKYIKNENDRFILNEKIINTMLKIRYKKEGLLSKVDFPLKFT